MSGLRSLGVCYLAAASVFTLAATLSTHRTAIGAFTQQIRQRIENGFPASDDGPVRVIDLAPPAPDEARTLARATRAPRPDVKLTPRLSLAAPMPFLIAPDLPPMEPQASPAPARIKPDQHAPILARLQENLTPELLKNFSLFLYVSTAPKGPLAQHLYVIGKDDKGALILIHDWAASTGRERIETSPLGRRSFTATPRGYFELDPDRMYKSYHSTAWNGAMPYAMFFNWENQGAQTGVAIHAATGKDIAKLGQRASAGCIHLSPAHAQELYNLIRTQYRGAVPRFAYDVRTQTMSNRGELMRAADGTLKMAEGYRVLTFIENFGGEKLLAALD